MAFYSLSASLHKRKKCFLTNIAYDIRFGRSNFCLYRLHNANGFAFPTAIKDGGLC